MKTWLAFVVVILGPGPGAGLGVQHRRAARSSGNHARSRSFPPGQKQVGTPGEKGATYYALEAQTTRLTTTVSRRARGGRRSAASSAMCGPRFAIEPATSGRDCA